MSGAQQGDPAGRERAEEGGTGEHPDRIRLTGLRADTVVGIHAWERRIRQTLRIDLELPVDARRAAASERIEDALDYGAVTDAVRACCAEAECLLIETLAERIAAALLTRFDLPWLRLTLHKPGAVRDCDDVALTIERSRVE